MKRTFKLFQICLLICGVIGAEADEVMTVIEGDSVTLDPDLTQTQGIILMLWRFGDKGSTIAQIDGNVISYPSHIDIFRGRLQLDQTGSLTIRNMRIKHSGLYKLQIDHSTGTTKMTFSVAVSASPSVIDVVEAKIKSVSVVEGDLVTLQTDVTETHVDELIVWRFGNEGKLIAECDKEANRFIIYETDERFRDRLKLDHQTGSLTITHTRTEDSGIYTVKISSNRQTMDKRFILTVSAPGLSSGAVAGIVVGLLLVFAGVAAAGVIFYRHKISKLKGINSESVSVEEGRSATLNTDVPEVQTDDQIEWRFGNEGTLIAETKGGISEIYEDVLDGRFRGRLKLDKKTGSLTITNTEMKHDGVYELKIQSGSGFSYKIITVTVRAREIPVNEGESVTLNTETEIQTDDQILWRFGETLIIQIKGGKRETFDDVAGGRFRERLKLDEKTGSLTITDMIEELSGPYKLQIISSRGTTDRSFSVTVWEKHVDVYEGDPATLVTDTEIHSEDQIQWLFEDKNSEINGGSREITFDGADDRLKLDKKTGSLTIRNTRTTDSGLYKLQIKSSSGIYYRKIRVNVSVRMVGVEEGKPVTLNTETEIQKDDLILWMCGENLIAQIKKGKRETFDDVADGRFRDRLKLDEKTGSLTITDMRYEHSGVYDLQIISSRGTTDRRFRVIVVNFGYSYNKVMEGDDVTLPSSTSLKGDEIVHWLFNDETISTGMNKDINMTSYRNVRFGDRLQLDHQTGSLTIRNTRTSDTGYYYLKLLRCGIERKFKVTVSARMISVEEGKPVTLNPDTEIQREDLIQWVCGENLIAQIKEGKKETFDVLGGRFRDRLKLDEKTGSLTITDMRYGESGLYKLQIIGRGRNTDRSFSVKVLAREIPVKKRESLTLNTDTEIQREDLIQWMYRGNLIAQIKGGKRETFDKVAGGRFRDRLKLDEKTGSLTITDMRDGESGPYKLQIFSSRGITDKTFSVTVKGIIPPLPPHLLRPLKEERRVNESATALKPQSNKEIRDGEKESVTVVMPLLSDVEERQETSSL